MNLYEVTIVQTTRVIGHVKAESLQKAVEVAKSGNGIKIREELPTIRVEPPVKLNSLSG